MTSFSKVLGLPQGPVSLADHDSASTPGFKGGEAAASARMKDLSKKIGRLTEILWADGTFGHRRNLLLVLQGMDTSGKGGIVKHVVSMAHPYGVKITSFKTPTPEELKHDFLWRHEKAVPPAGCLGVHDRSHYEAVLIEKVRSLSPADEIERRYGAINDFEADLVEQGTTVVKCMLHISPTVQMERFHERLEHREKWWKYNPGDIDERQLWTAYTEAYEIALSRCNTEAAPWHVVPSDLKWYRNLAIAELLLEGLQSMGLEWPEADFDVEAEKRRLGGDTIL